ncbi:bifunctional 4-hydroxy-2-oxoglutarate aldolase/2-dehydro-3-deoxy-phosphogluconate aldolase [uncultured Arcticibacterium sp.]|uniref:bifunctional 4-hydroxy-2-oxoglutarate aldolase/2-dehydro-3-deoxy-phosphogluconate aldolase n=1 Tax=uncultured Arcticibacterium sp. TaxID=2173042 RepID=UPI0030FA4A96
MEETFFNKLLKDKILAAVTLESSQDALFVAEALLKGGLNVMEVPLRTDAALEAIALIKKEFPEMKIGAGTILRKEQIATLVDIGVDFGLSAGFNENLVEEIAKSKLPYIPGVFSPSEIERAYQFGFKVQKVFPIGQLGGTKYLKAISGPYGHLDLKFIPMGGVNQENFAEYIKVGNVIAAGGSWMVNKELIKNKEFKAIEDGVRALIKTSHA